MLKTLWPDRELYCSTTQLLKFLQYSCLKGSVILICFTCTCGNCMLIYVTHVTFLVLKKENICFRCLLFTPCLSLSIILSRYVTGKAISLVIDHSSGWAPPTLQSLVPGLWGDSINFHLKEHACFQWDTEHLCRPEGDNISLSKATELCLPVS